MHKNIINAGIAGIGTVMSYLIGGWDSVLKILAVAIAIDYITGIMCATYNKNLSSEIGWKGLMKKAAIFLVVILAHQLDLVVAIENPVFRTMACYFYIGNEGISVTENLGLMGIQLPGGLENALKKLKDNNSNAGA